MTTYLQICKEELNPELRASYHRASTFYQMADAASVITLSSGAVCGFIGAVLYAPIFAPLSAFLSAFIFKQTYTIHTVFKNWSGQAAERANQLRETYKHHQEIKDSTPRQIRRILKKKGIKFISRMEKNDPRLVTLTPLIARHLFWENHVAGLEKEKQERLTTASKLEKENPIKNRNKIFELRGVALEFENEALKSKVKNAFISAVIRRPYFTGTLEDVGTLSPLGGQERAINIQTGAPNSTDLFTLKNSSTISYHAVKQLEVSDLGRRLIP